jgi:5-methyltetrahydropteroyltriglutamate--homocysteine methyltransferase
VTPQAFTTTVVGSPRIGPKRELKRATEGYWAGRTSRTELENVAATLRRDMWKGLADAGLDSVPVNTFSYYDQVLDTAVLLGALRTGPRRFPTTWTGTSPRRAATKMSRRWR